jgi:hypothetical protein
MQEVYDTFSAIVQLPLLRYNIELGAQRMRNFRNAKLAAANVSQQAAQKQGGIQLGEKRAQTAPQPAHLLKSAVLNNARERA